jgi:cAMP phosphodiesterase
MNFYYRFIYIFFLFCSPFVWSQRASTAAFKVIPLGVKGGIDESNLSAYLLTVADGNEYICLDAGTLNYGIQKAIASKLFKDSASNVLKKQVKAYLISHPHLDHVAGLIINSPDDSPKSIYGLPFCINVLKDKYFTWENWANFADAGEQPFLKKYHYQVFAAGEETPIESTPFKVRAFALSHGNPYQSTAFLIRNQENYLLYLGDTGADSLEKTNNLRLLWKEIAPLIKAQKLKAIFIEVSYPDEQPLNQLFGHLTPSLLMNEMNVLATIAGKEAMKQLPVAITHMKPSGAHEKKIEQQLREKNKLQLKLVFPQQAKQLTF